jgi:BirA family biotin operon repressor/biotin-[acetyl-CoA-carboxylase] ligase
MAERGATALGHPRVHLRVTDSTNERARELAVAGAPHGTLVTAAEQTAGRGRQGRRWSAPRGSALLMSLVLRSPPSLLPLLAAVAVCDVAGEQTLVKWPNDVVVAVPGDGVAPAPKSATAPTTAPATARTLAKLAGILAEGRLQEGWLVLGIGLNVAVALDALAPELRTGSGHPGGGLPAATMGLRPDDVEDVLARLLAALQRRLAEPAETTLAAWRRRDALRGRPIAWAGGRGRADGIDGEGRLIVALEGGGRTALGAGEVHLEPPA